MLEMMRYEEMAAKAVVSFAIALGLVLCGLFILGIELVSCNLFVLAGGIGVVTLILWLGSVLKL